MHLTRNESGWEQYKIDAARLRLFTKSAVPIGDETGSFSETPAV